MSTDHDNIEITKKNSDEISPKGAKQIEELKMQRANTKGCITRIKTLITSKGSNLSATELECRLGILESYWKMVLTFQASIERLSPGDSTNNAVRGELEDLYCEVKSKILSLLPNQGRFSSSEGNTSFTFPAVPKSNLPPLRLPQFSGKYSDYPNFIATFNKLVHDDSEKSVTEKYNHLRNCLVGPALRTIESLGKSAETYIEALDKLKDRYDNKFLVFQEHITELFDLPKVCKGSATQLRSLVDNVSAHVSALRVLGSDTDITNAIIIHIVHTKLDSESQSRWDESVDYKKFSTWSDCEMVLSRRCQFLEARERKPPFQQTESRSNRIQINKQNKNPTSLKVTKSLCTFCAKSDHSIKNCQSFSQLSVVDRFEEVKKLSLCINCLSKGHSVGHCRASRCRVCSRPHHTLLHRYQNLPPPQQLSSISAANDCESNHIEISESINSTNRVNPMSSSSANSTLCSAACESRSEKGRNGNVLLATAVVQIKDRTGCYHIARALLDSASQLNLITANLAQKLRLQRQYIKADISGIGDVSSRVNFETWATVKSRVNDYETDLNMWVLPSITGIQPESEISVSSWRIPSNLELADPKFHKPQAIDLLIGADKFFELLSVGQIRLGEDFPTLQKTLFGWIVCGRYKVPEIVKQICNVSYVLEQLPVDDSLNNLVEKFWSIEDVSVKSPKLTEEQQRCEQLFLDSVRILENGRLMVKLPLKESPKVLGNSVEIAKRRFLSLERKLNRNPDLKRQYVEFMLDYESQGHMEIISDKRIPPIHYYMPHQCVLRPESSSTKLRVVYDASCRTTSNISLNDILMIGPTVQNDLFSILLRFRCWKFALTADVSQMYRQILVYPIDTNLQCILWRENTQDELKTFSLKTVTYGTAAAPYLATRCLNYLADINSQKYPLAEKIIKEDFYVDDLLTGADTLDEIKDIQLQLQTVLQTAGLTLRKWYSNSSELLKHIPERDREKPIRLNDSDIIKTLGIAWEPVSDTFRFTFKPSERLSPKITKRVVLSDIARLFDPLGYVNPVVLRAKVFMQELWLLNLNWDESLPLEFYSRWQKFRNELYDLNTIAIPRRIMPDTKFYRTEIHGFADASIRAYGCCIYTRSVDHCGNVLVRLLTAKSKVAPTKTTRTLPCLELCASELLAKVLVKVKDNLQKPISNVFLWTDSQIVLSWLASHASMWQTFVANRVSTIQELTANATWRYVPSKSNPADIISRGSSIADLKQSCWFTGPKFLYEPCECWPKKKEKLTDLPEKRKLKKILVCVVQQSFLDTIYKFSTFSKTRRIYAYVLRFIANLKRRRAKVALVIGDLCAQELENALLKLVWLIQHREFSEEIQALEQGEMISPKGCLQSLNPFLDNQMLLRVGGRLQNADLPYNAKCPILLPKNNPFVKSYVNYLHFRHFHAGPQALIAIIRQQFWVVNIRDYARRIVKECIHCFRYRPRLMQQMMADLPKDRVVGSMAFMNAGVDFCGPIWTTHKIRGRRPYKSYIAVFICFLSKGVHLEVVSDLSSEAFILALKRFVSRRRLCRRLYCDNATNFVGARNQLKEFRDQFLAQHSQKNIAQWCSEEAIEFHHIPPRAPHFGGIWEAAVKSAKSHLFRTLQNSLLTFEELTTVCSQIEATLNCRPICKLSSDPNDEEVLTPAHFWNQAPLNCFVEPNLMNETMSHYVNRWRRISIIQQHFWRRWSAEYLSSLHNRYKWKFSTPNVVEGMMTLIHDDNLPPQKWLLGRIIKAIPGKDGKVRVVDVKTRAGILRRAIHKLAPLPTNEDI